MTFVNSKSKISVDSDILKRSAFRKNSLFSEKPLEQFKNILTNDRIRSYLKFFPLEFRNAIDEENYSKKTIKVVNWLKMIPFLGLAVILVLLVMPTVSIFSENQELFKLACLLIYYIGNVLCIMLNLSFLFVKKTKQNLQKFHLISTSCLTGMHLIYIIVYGCTYTINNEHDLAVYSRHLNFYFYPLFLVLVWSHLKMNLCFELRTKINFWVYLMPPVAISITLFVSLGVTISKSSMKSSIGFLVAVCCVYSGFLISSYMIFFFERWCFELFDRLRFHDTITSINHIKEIRNAEVTAELKNVSVIEDITYKIKKIIAILREYELASECVEVEESVNLLNECYHILTETSDLYSIYYQAAGNPDEGLQEQFTNIYANRNMKRYQTRVRFGQVIDIKYDSNAATNMDKQQVFNNEDSASICERSNSIKDFNFKRDDSVFESPFFSLKPHDTEHFGKKYNINLLELRKNSPNLLAEVGSVLLAEHIDQINCQAKCLHKFLMRLQQCYVNAAFHNICHASIATHTSAWLINTLGIKSVPHVTSGDLVAITVAILGHCVAHPGYDNNYFSIINSPLAVLYSDLQILSNVHSSIVFFCLALPGSNIFESLPAEDFRCLRKRIIELIIATDYSSQQENVYRFRMRRKSKGCNMIESADDIWLVLRLVAAFGCQSDCFLDWAQHLEWSFRMFTELSNQEIDENRLNSPKDFYAKIVTYSQFASWRISQIDSLAAPLIKQIKDLDSSGQVEDECYRNFTGNRKQWESLLNSSEVVSVPKYIKFLTGDAVAPLRTLMYLYITYYESKSV